MLGFLGNVGPTELLIILLILILLFGASKIPQLARALGKSVKEFKKGMTEADEEAKDKPEEKDKK